MRPKVLATTPLFVVADVPRSLAFGMANRDDFDMRLSCAETPAHIRPNGGQNV